MCEKTFKVTFACNGSPGDRSVCTYEEESVRKPSLCVLIYLLCCPNPLSLVQMDGGLSSFGTCVGFDPNKELEYDRKRNQCVIGRKRGILLKETIDPVCNPRFNVKIIKEMKSDMLQLYFRYVSLLQRLVQMMQLD